jgi:hypothetical protein
VADPASLWTELGFSVEAGVARVGTIAIGLDAPGKGVTSWTLAAVEGPDAPGGGGGDSTAGASEIDGLATNFVDDPPAPGGGDSHPNGVVSLDHVVVSTPHLETTVSRLGRFGLVERRRRDAGRGPRPTTQVFFRLGEAILELVGAPDSDAEGPCQFWGLAFTVSDMDLTVAALGEKLRDVKSAVQPGRFIASLDWAAGSGVPIAFMTC